jgi:hypothetical protein
MTAKTPAERQRAFKAAQAAAGMVRFELYLSPAQQAKLKALGGSDWLRARIDRAKVK